MSAPARRPPRRLADVAAAHRSRRPGLLRKVGVGALAGLGAFGLRGAPGGAALAVVAWTVGRVAARAPRVDEDLAELLELAARSVRSGMAAPAALDEARRVVSGPVAAALPGRGEGRITDRFDRWADEVATPSARLVAGAVGAATAGGSDPARALDAAARVLRVRQAARRDAEVAASQARASALLMGLAPAAILVLSAMTDRSLVARIAADPLAVACVAAGVALEAVGFWWMQRMVRAVEEVA